MNKSFLKISAILGALAVALGAFGAHTLKQILKDDVVSIFDTGVRYQFYHVFALFISGILYKEFTNNLVRWAGIFFITGIILFSGSLYFLTYAKGAEIEGYSWVGAITPFGGLFFIFGWLCLFGGMFKSRAFTT